MSYRNHIIFSNILFVANIILVVIAFAFGYFLLKSQKEMQAETGELYVSEVYEAPNVVVDAGTTVGTVTPIWAALAQGGEEQGVNMLKGTETHMQQLGVRYVRLDHIFDDDYYGVVSQSSSDELRLDWSRLDETVDSITKSGAKPFLSLGYFPSALSTSKIDQPREWKKWQWLVTECIRHYSGQGGKAISDVYYEVWNEPDLSSFGSWHYSSSKNYLTLYKYAALGAKSVRSLAGAQRFYFGGPAITATYENWVEALVKYSKSEGLPLDFVSWHRYSPEPLQYRQDAVSLRTWLATQGSYQLIVSEFGPDSEKSAVYSTRAAGAHAVTTARQTIGSGIDWLFGFEVKDGPGQGDMGWGMLRHNEANLATKPRYKAYVMMKQMTGERLLLQGEGSDVKGWAVRKDADVSLILSNYGAGQRQETVPVQVKGLPQGTYLAVWDSLSGKGGDSQVVISPENPAYTKTFTLEYGDVVKVRLRRL